jgi:hypothetical protein
MSIFAEGDETDPYNLAGDKYISRALSAPPPALGWREKHTIVTAPFMVVISRSCQLVM